MLFYLYIRLQVKFNTKNCAYDDLYKENDADVIAALMWYWLDSLREPVLHPQDMPAMLSQDDVISALHVFDKVSDVAVQRFRYLKLCPVPCSNLRTYFR